MAFNPDRFVIIDGVQILKTRALRDGLIDEKGRIIRDRGDEQPVSAGPGSNRARSSSSARRGRGGTTRSTSAADDDTPPADDDSDDE